MASGTPDSADGYAEPLAKSASRRREMEEMCNLPREVILQKLRDRVIQSKLFYFL